MENEIYHYGVPGMKWGVRRDTRILANHRRNVEVRQLKDKYRSGKMTKEQYSSAVKGADAKKKKYMTDVENQFRNAKNDAERNKLGENISKKTVKEVPNATVKRGVAVANQLFGTYNIGSTAVTTAGLAIANPAFAAAYLGAGAVTVAAEAGYRYVTRKLLDKTA